MALRRRGLVRKVVGVCHSEAGREASLAKGAVDEALLDLEAAVAEADLVVCCGPVALLPEHLGRAAAAAGEGALLTDVGSTKARLVEAVPGRFPRNVRFVGGHPLAGGEKTGVAAARDDLFENRLVVLTPTEASAEADVARLERFWEAVGARTLRMDPHQHDVAVASTSHVPHLVAAALAAALPERLFPLAARGFLDTTRIAAGSPELWLQIVFDNREPILAAMEPVLECLEAFRAALAAKDPQRLVDLLALAKQHRDALGS